MSTLIGYARVQAAIHHVCEAFGVRKDELLSRDRHERVAWPRQVAMALAYNLTDMRQHELAPIFDRSVHDVRRSVAVVRDRTQVDRKAKVCVRKLRRIIEHETFG